MRRVLQGDGAFQPLDHVVMSLRTPASTILRFEEVYQLTITLTGAYALFWPKVLSQLGVTSEPFLTFTSFRVRRQRRYFYARSRPLEVGVQLAF
jgi:hypothetical protein